jgi:altronate dehydratase
LSKKYNSRHEYVSERMVDWLADFADKEGGNLIKNHSITQEDIKEAGHIENILQIVHRQKKQSVEDKVMHYRQLVGLDQLNAIEKEGEQDGKKEVVASRLPLSIRDKIAQQDANKIIEQMKEYIGQIIKNRNGAIATPAIFDQLGTYFQVDKDWLREHYDMLQQIIDKVKKDFQPTTYNAIPVDQLAKTDPINKEKEPPLFAQPPSPQGG